MSQDTEQLIQHALDAQPIEFGEKFSEIVTQRISDKLAERRDEIAKTLFNNPTQADNEGN